MSTLYLGIDVGTGSARAGLFDVKGTMHGTATREIAINRPQADFVEQSSANIWKAVCEAVREAMAQAGAKPEQVKGIGFDATCSMVVMDAEDKPVTVSPTGDDQWDIIVWMDHRALDQTARINANGHDVLKYVGGTISPEMQTPKLLWLKENMPSTWERADQFYDLPDWLVHRATGVKSRSLCSLVCKWTYTKEGWSESYFREIGLGDLADEKFCRLGTNVLPPGDHAGGLTHEAAKELGLVPRTSVGVSLIDAHAGGVGVIGASIGGAPVTSSDFNHRIALIGGTSSCHMAVSQEPRFVPGVWGPYTNAMLMGHWLTEGGQSATGALVDHVIFSHAKSADLKADAKARGITVYEILNERLEKLSEGLPHPGALTRNLHVLPYFHGNRSPRADPTLRGVISGLKLDDSVDHLAILYLATIQAIAHGTRHIIEALNEKGYEINTIMACGGGTKNPVFLREHADATGCRIVLPREPEAVLLGSAMMGGVSVGEDFETDIEVMSAMSHAGEVIEPAGGEVTAYHAKKREVFHRMHTQALELREMMAD